MIPADGRLSSQTPLVNLLDEDLISSNSITMQFVGQASNLEPQELRPVYLVDVMKNLFR